MKETLKKLLSTCAKFDINYNYIDKYFHSELTMKSQVQFPFYMITLCGRVSVCVSSKPLEDEIIPCQKHSQLNLANPCGWIGKDNVNPPTLLYIATLLYNGTLLQVN